MDLGRIKSSIFDRSVFKLIKDRQSKEIKRAYLGQQAATKKLDNANVVTSLSSKPMAVYDVANKLAASGAKLDYVTVNIVMDAASREIRLKEIINDLEEQCRHFNITIAQTDVRVSARAIKPIVTVFGLGHAQVETDDSFKLTESYKPKPEDVIVAIGVIGLSGIRRVIKEKEEEILKRYTRDVLDKALAKLEELDTTSISDLVYEEFRKEGIKGNVYSLSEGGVIDCLWNIAEKNHIGFEVDIRKIPVRQEIIEICEMFSINPYEMESIGSLLVTYSGNCGIVNILNEKNVKAFEVGCFKSDNKKILRSLSDERFVEMPGQDEIYKVINN
ncbi:MAG: hypothetical protein K6F41_02800 [Lachnospira sp.]|nr:hypothetical protein [Lachnospira sp.]